MANFDRRDSSGGRDFNRGSFNRGPRRSVQMYKAVCAKCGNECEVPFRPTGGKPVYCSNCFEKNGGGSRERRESPPQSQPQFNKQFESLNNKLDKILELLNTPRVADVVEKEITAEEKPKPVKENSKKV